MIKKIIAISTSLFIAFGSINICASEFDGDIDKNPFDYLLTTSAVSTEQNTEQNTEHNTEHNTEQKTDTTQQISTIATETTNYNQNSEVVTTKSDEVDTSSSKTKLVGKTKIKKAKRIKKKTIKISLKKVEKAKGYQIQLSKKKKFKKKNIVL